MASTPLPVPQMGVVETVVVIEWLRTDGDLVETGEPIVVVESEKAETELESPASGRLEILIQADDDVEVAVGTVLGSIVAP